MRVLVTGGAGFIGSHIVEHFQGGAEIRVLDNLRSGFRHNLAGLKHEFIFGSILDRAVVREALKGVDYVFHLAAMISVFTHLDPPTVERYLEETARALAPGGRALISAFLGPVWRWLRRLNARRFLLRCVSESKIGAASAS